MLPVSPRLVAIAARMHDARREFLLWDTAVPKRTTAIAMNRCKRLYCKMADDTRAIYQINKARVLCSKLVKMLRGHLAHKSTHRRATLAENMRQGKSKLSHMEELCQIT